jgi:hypothetical protein
MRAFVDGIGLAGPGLEGWNASRAILSGTQPYRSAPTAVSASPLLPAAERRRAGMPVKLSLAAGTEAVQNARREVSAIATVFTSSSGDCDNVHAICETLATPERQVSPTRFHNSVHNAAAGYWSIATQCRAPSTSLCGRDESFAVGLLDAAVQAATGGEAVALIAYDHPYPEPLASLRRIAASFCGALVLSPQAGASSLARLEIAFQPGKAAASRMQDAALEALRAGVPAARCLPLLAAIAAAAGETVIIALPADAHLRVTVAPCS